MNDIISTFLTLLKSMIQEAVREEMNRKKEKQLMNFKETCEFLGCSPSALNKWKAANKIPYKKLGKRVFFNREEVLNALKESNYNNLKKLNL